MNAVVINEFSYRMVNRTLFNMLHRMSDPDSLSRPVFYTCGLIIMCCNPSAKMIHIKCFLFQHVQKMFLRLTSYQHKFHTFISRSMKCCITGNLMAPLYSVNHSTMFLINMSVCPSASLFSLFMFVNKAGAPLG
jgi:hypothetical protein